MLTILKFISLQASHAHKARNYELALAASRTARIYNIFGLFSGIVRLVLILNVVVVLAYTLRQYQ